MKYVALLRGINVGGANKISMADLRSAFASADVSEVTTYINSGNVLFSSDESDRALLAQQLRAAVEQRHGLDIDIQLRTRDEIAALVAALPFAWRNDDSMKCDVVFLPADLGSAQLLKQLDPREGIEDALALAGALVWRVDRTNATTSRLTKIVGTPLYSRVTVRNCNTVRKLLELLDA